MMRVWQQIMIALARNQALKSFVQRRSTLSGLATRFVGGHSGLEAVSKSQTLSTQGIKTSLFFLGEYVSDCSVIDQTLAELKSVIHQLAHVGLDVYISVDPTQIGLQIAEDVCRHTAFFLAQEIKTVAHPLNESTQAFLMLDMEDSSVTDTTIRLYQSLIEASLPAALTLQAYLYRTESDLQAMVEQGGIVRLVKGAFAEHRTIAFTRRAEITANYLKLADIMLSDRAKQTGFYPIFATHDQGLIEQIVPLAQRQGWAPERYEFELLYGVKPELQTQLIQRGQRLRLYLPFGTDWWPYAIRRVGENPRNARFLVRSLLSS